MKKVDYSKIAKRFDKNRRKLAKPDRDLEQFLKARNGAPCSVLDIGCGTGNYLELQVDHFQNENIEWFGLEPSEDMRKIAMGKVAGVSFLQGQAENLPFESGRFDFVISTFAFHHFVDKPAALDEMERVLSEGGMLKLSNIAPEKMSGWIYYKYFPTTYTEDLVRFWKVNQLQEELERRGLNVQMNIDIRESDKKLSDALEDFKNRDASQLWTISEAEYQKGLAVVESELDKNTESTFLDVMAIMNCIARKS